jgi:hypothetical protein
VVTPLGRDLRMENQGMTLGIALVLIFILYLIDKHNRWRIAAKLTAGLIVLCILAVGAFFGWSKYEDDQTEKRNIAYRTKMQPVWDCTERNIQFSNATEECEKDSTVVLHAIPPPAFVPTAPYQIVAPNSKLHPVLGSAVVTGELTSIYKRCYFNTGSYPCGIDIYLPDGAVISILHKGDRLQLLSQKTRSSGGTEIYEVRFQQWTGWVDANDLSPENEQEK